MGLFRIGIWSWYFAYVHRMATERREIMTTPDQPTGMNELRDVLERIWPAELLDSCGLKDAEIYDPAIVVIQQLVERCIGQDEPTTQSLLDDGPPYIDNPVAVRRNELRAELRHNLQQAGLLRGDETENE